MDSQYVSRILGSCLTEALAEIVEVRPLDPIRFLELWIRRYKHNQTLELQRAAHQRELEEQRRRIREETLHHTHLEQEQNRIRAAQQQRRETAADPSGTVNEPNDQEEHKAGAAGEEQAPEIPIPEESVPPERLGDSQSESKEEEKEPGEEKAEEQPDERKMEKEEHKAGAAGEEQAPEIPIPEESVPPERLGDSQSESKEEEKEPGEEKAEEQPDERKMEKEEDDGA